MTHFETPAVHAGQETADPTTNARATPIDLITDLDRTLAQI